MSIHHIFNSTQLIWLPWFPTKNNTCVKICNAVYKKPASENFTTWYTPHCWGHLVLVQSLPTIHTSHQSVENLHFIESIFNMFWRAVFEVTEVKGGAWSRSEILRLKKKKCKKNQMSNFVFMVCGLELRQN